MSTVPPEAARDAHYHLLAATELWAAFEAGMQADLIRDAAERARKRAERRRETTYERGELGGH